MGWLGLPCLEFCCFDCLLLSLGAFCFRQVVGVGCMTFGLFIWFGFVICVDFALSWFAYLWGFICYCFILLE